MKPNQKDWSCPKKQQARCETIIDQYRQNFEHSLPAKKQYWTMCGQCAAVGCEPDQIIKSGLINTEQFRGVENNPEIHNLNIQAYPNLQFINEDFYRAMVIAHHAKEFNPGIVNADLPRTPDGGAAYISKLMAFLTETTSKVLFVANMILRMKYYTTKDGDYVINLLNKYPQFRFAMSEGNWELVNGFYEYPGAGETGLRTYMGSFVFVKK